MYKYSKKIWNKLEKYLKVDQITYLIDHVDEDFVYVMYQHAQVLSGIRKNSSHQEEISVELLPYIHLVAERDDLDFHIAGTVQFDDVEEGFKILIESDFSMEEMIEDALCEEKRYKTYSCIPVYSKRTLDNKEKLERLMKINEKRGFHIYDPNV